MKTKTRFGKAVYTTVLAMLLMAVFVYAAVPSQTFLSDSISYFKGNLGINEDNPSEELEVDGTVLIDMNTNNIGLNIDSEATSPGSYGLQVVTGQGAKAAYIQNNNVLFEVTSGDSATGSVFAYRNDDSATTAGPVAFIEQDNTGDDQPALSIQNDGSGTGLYVDQDGATGAGAYFDLAISNPSIGYGFLVKNRAEQTGGVMAGFVQDSETSTANVVNIVNDGTGNGLLIDQNGAGKGLYIDQDGEEYGLHVETSANRPAILISGGACNAGQYGFYADGTGNLYWCKNGVSTKLN